MKFLGIILLVIVAIGVTAIVTSQFEGKKQAEKERDQLVKQDAERRDADRIKRERKARACPSGYEYSEDAGGCRTKEGCPPEKPYWHGDEKVCRDWAPCKMGLVYFKDLAECRLPNGCPTLQPYKWSNGICYNQEMPPEVAVVDAWLNSQRRGDTGVEFWDPKMVALDGAKRLFNVRSWEIKSFQSRAPDPGYMVRFRVEASTQGGIPVDLIYIVYLNDNHKIFAIADSSGMILP